MICRKNEEKKVRYRTDRCFRVGNDWYFATREGKDIGPYKNRVAAERAVPRYVKIMLEDKTSGIYARRIAMEGLWASTLYA
ncbi:DUF6316 family protein [Teredinibacter sp. KSP-S5-2]|uniref:DUF6316 family protein n=1 Tax=Teredinibacter sp. KSP-S5-2 TaxID=3034506 RepID=UPI0029352ACC|nr:DUF6316 family protein [Teredinibacter sp. KSP-S5-2]WNO07539.1 DUF6316 family protein [Teredinibacter sp. KSP-S5-2]